MRKQLGFGSLIAIFLISLVSSADADVSLVFSSDGGSTFSTNFDILAGDDLTVELFLQDDAPGGILATEGLSSFGTSAVASAGFGVITGVAVDPAFDFSVTESFTATTLALGGGNLAPPAPPIASTIRLGQLTFDSSDIGVTTFTFSDLSGAPETVANDFTVLDDDVFGGAAPSFTVNAVPEPGSAVLLVVGAAALALRRRR